jgi:hypothetical protein
MFSAKTVSVPQEEIKVSGTVYNLGEYPPITIKIKLLNFLNYTFKLREIRYFADIKYSCPVNDGTKHVRVALSRNRFILLTNGSNITVKIRVYREYVYGIVSPSSFSIPVGIE